MYIVHFYMCIIITTIIIITITSNNQRLRRARDKIQVMEDPNAHEQIVDYKQERS